MARMGGVAAGASPFSRLTPYQVGLCSLLAQFARGKLQLPAGAERRLFQLLLIEATATKGLRQKGLAEFREELCVDREGITLWEAFSSGLRGVDSPDVLFDTFQELEANIARDPSSTSPLHSSGVFGRYARRCVLAFKDASFEATVRLYDAVRAYVDALPAEDAASPPSAAAPGPTPDGDGAPRSGSPGGLTISPAQLDQLAQGLMRDLPLSFGRVPFPVVSRALAALHGQLPLNHVVDFLRYMSSLQQRLADDAGSRLRSFHEGHQRRSLVELRAGWETVPLEDGLPDLVQHTSLALAGLHCEMRHVGDALLAVGESIRAAQEASDGSCLCACLYMLSLILLQAGLAGKALAMMRRSLHRAEVLGLPMLQSSCCLGIACALSSRPGLSGRRGRGLLWKDSAAKAPQEAPSAVVLRAQGAPGGPGGAGGGAWAGGGGATSSGARAFGFTNAGGAIAASGSTGRGGLGVLAALLGRTASEDGGSAASAEASASGGGGACRDALAHLALASQLAAQAAAPSDARPKLLLAQAEVARAFGLQPLTPASCELALGVYSKELVAEDRALALCQLASAAAERSHSAEVPLLRAVAHQLPHAGHLWAHVVGPQLVQALVRAGECGAASALLFQAAGAVGAAPDGSAAAAAQRLRAAANGLRISQRQLLAAHLSAREAVQRGARRGVPGDVCGNLLCLTDLHLEAHDPVGSLAPCLRCLSEAEGAQLPQYRAGALVRLARAKLEMRDVVGALQLAEEVTPMISAAGSARLRADALMVQADALLELLALSRRERDDVAASRLLREIFTILTEAVQELEAIADLNPLRNCHYLLARVCHENGDQAGRNKHAGRFRRISEFLSGHSRTSWRDLDLPREKPGGGGREGAGVLLQRAAAASGGPEPAAQPGAGGGCAESAAAAACPALAELLALAERRRPERLAGLAGALPPAAAELAARPRAHTAVGDLRALYPMAAALGA